MTIIIICSFIFILIVGFITIVRRYRGYIERNNFATKYRQNLIILANIYFQTQDIWTRQGSLDSEIYIWLTKNVNHIQRDLGSLGTLHYVAPFQIYHINNYEIIINTIPKFRLGTVESLDINWADDCLLRYIGVLENTIKTIEKKIKNPFVWFSEGFREIISLPLFIFNWFGILGDATLSKITRNAIFNIITGIGGLVTFASGIVTIVQGKEQTVAWVKHLIHK